MTQSAAALASEATTLTRVEGRGFWAVIYLSSLNQRIQVLEYEADEVGAMVATLTTTAITRGFGKVFLKASAGDQESFEKAGMMAEAHIDGYYAGKPAVVMSLFLDQERRQQPFAGEQEEILANIRERPADSSVPPLPAGYVMLPVTQRNAEELAQLYGTVFASYPFPITSVDYLVSTMESHVRYRIIRDTKGSLVAAASAETSPELRNAEMTDFATLPSQRGLGLAQHLLAALEGDMKARRIRNLYTVARARSAGMNRVFYNRGYEWTGTLVNNCHIAGQFEDMHVWCRTV